MWTIPFAFAADGGVSLPLERWEAMLAAAEAAAVPPAPPVEVLHLDRSIEGHFVRGVFTGSLRLRLRVPAGPVRVPVLDAAASIAAVELDGRPTSLLPQDGAYTVGIASPGDHLVRVDFFVGREDDRFARRLQLAVPPAGPTRVSVWLPEPDVEAELGGGAVLASRAEAGGTRLEGQLDGLGRMDLAWKGKAAGAVPARVESRLSALFELREALLRGVATVDVEVLEGETDRVRLRLPEGVEVVDVEGDAVLQWRAADGRLEVLLRWLLSDETRLKLRFQQPVSPGEPVELRMPLPEAGEVRAVGVQGPAGVSATVRSAERAQPLRDLPADLAELSPNPLLLGFQTAGEPRIVLDVARQAEAELGDTVVDELEAATVLIEDGAQITRMELHVRNQARQYLALRLPEGATLTRARLDGRPLQAATGPDGRLLLPLLRSESLAADQVQTWTVREGETLGAIADRFYADPAAWARLRLENGLDGDALEVGQVLRIPAAGTRESRFVIDLAWTSRGEALGPLGHRDLRLPELDAEVGAVEWHLLLPESLEPLRFGGNLSPYSHLRYDHLRRLRDFVELGLGVRGAWAGEQASLNILSRRKGIYELEQRRAGEAREVATSFPMVGERYRFERRLPGAEQARVSVSWMDRRAMPGLRWGAGLAAALAVRGRRAWMLLPLLGLGWYVEGVHRALILGVDLGLISRLAGRPRWSWPSREALLDAWSFGLLRRLGLAAAGLALLLMVPMFWSTLLLAGLAWRARRAA